MKKRLLMWFCLLGALLCGLGAQAQDGRLAVRAGYYLGTDFGSRIPPLSLLGVQFGLDAPIARLRGDRGSLYFSPTVVLGGSLTKGSDTDGNLYRLMVTYRGNLGRSDAYGGLGLGASFTQAHGNQFADVGGFTAQFLLGYAFRLGNPRAVRPFLEISYFAATHGALSGFAFEVGVRF